MFITNKRVVMPEFIEIEALKIQVVKEFKLLGSCSTAITVNKQEIVCNQKNFLSAIQY